MALQQRLIELAQAAGADTGRMQSDMVLMLGPSEAVSKLLEGTSAFNTWVNTSGKLPVFMQLLDSLAGLSYLTQNAAAMTSIANSSTAMNSVVTKASVIESIVTSRIAMSSMLSDAPMSVLASRPGVVSAIAASRVAMELMIESELALTKLRDGGAWSIFTDSKVLQAVRGSLALTADSAPGFATVSASSSFGAGYEAWRAFDGDAGTRWGAVIAAASGARLQVGFALPRNVHTVRITPHADGVYTAWALEYSDDASTWNVALNVTGYAAVAGVATSHPVATPGRHRYWRVRFIAADNYASTRELQLDGWI